MQHYNSKNERIKKDYLRFLKEADRKSEATIDGIRKAFDERSYLQRYTPRRAKSIWSQINREHVGRLTKTGRMTPHGQRQVDAAKADGRLKRAYAPMRGALDANFPADLRKAIDASPRARKTFQSLGRQNLYALAFRTTNMKTPA